MFLSTIIMTLSAAVAFAEPVLKDGWDAKQAGDKVMAGMIKVSAPQVKGAHDADLALVGERAYVVEHDNDIKPGHGAGKAQYCVLTVVNLKSMQVERVIPMAKSAEAFANVKLPSGACFVPRVIRLDEHTLRCYFACEDQSGRRQSQTWYRDFDLRSQAFSPDILSTQWRKHGQTLGMPIMYRRETSIGHGYIK